MAFVISTIYKSVDKFSAPLKKMEQANSGFANKLNGTKNMLLGLAGGVSVASLAFVGFNAIKDFDASLQSLKAITGLSGNAFIPFKKEIIAIGDATKKSYVDVAKAMELIGSAKPELLNDAKAMGELTKASILLSRASGMELPESAAALTKAMNQFGVGADQAAKFVDILSTSEQKGTATTSQIIESLINGGSTAKTLGLSFDNTNAFIQAYAKAGVIGSEAGTQMAAVLSKLATVSKKEFNPTQVGATKALDNLSKANLKYTDILKLVGPEKAKFLSTLINQNDVVQKLSGNLYDVGNAQKQAEERNKSFNEIVNRLVDTFKNFVIKANESSGALSIFGGIISFVTEHLGTFLNIAGIALGLFVAYKTIMLGITAATWAYNLALDINLISQGYMGAALFGTKAGLALSTLWTGITTAATWLMTTSFGAATAAAWAFTVALLANPITWVVVGIMALIAGIILLIKNWEIVKNAVVSFVQYAWEGIKKVGQAVLSYLLLPLQLALKLISTLTGAEWAKDMTNKINDMTGSFSVDAMTKDKPVNIAASANDAQIRTIEKTTNKNNTLNLIDKTSGGVKAVRNEAPIPVMGITNDYLNE